MPTSTSVRAGNGSHRCNKPCNAQNDKLRNRMAADMKAVQIDSFDHNSNIHVQFTSNHEDYMHRGEHPIMQAGS